MSPVVIAIAVLIILVIVGMIIALQSANSAARKARALSVIKGRSGEGGKEVNARDAANKRRAEIAQKLKENDPNLQKKGKATISEKMQMAGMYGTSVRTFWIWSFVSMIASVAIAFLLKIPAPVLTLPFVAVIGLLGLPRMFLNRKIKKRQQKFLKDFADALEAMVRLLKSGMPVAEAIRMASREFTGPVGEEMSRIYDSQKIGIPLPEAAQAAARRMPVTEMQMFATGITIQQQTGSSLSEILTNLANVIRSRVKLKRKIQSLSSEAKASAMIIGALPFLVGGGMFLINNEFMMLLFTTTSGKIMVAFGLFWMGCGIMVMKFMINFKI